MSTNQTVATGDVWASLKAALSLDETAHTKGPASNSHSWNSDSLLASCGDGSRTAHLTGLAGTYIARGFNLDQTIEHCLLWNERNTPPLDHAKVIDACESIAVADARNHPNRVAKQLSLVLPNTPPTPLFDIKDARIDSFIQTVPPPQRWVLKNFLPLGIVAAVVAPGGSSKSQFLMQMAYSVATGIRLADHWPVGEVGAVLMLCAEDGNAEIHRRVHWIHQQLGMALDAAATAQLFDRFLIRSMVGEDILLTEKNQSGEVVRTPIIDRLLLTAKQVSDLKLIIIDPASRFRGGDENSNADATRFVQALEYLAQSTGATVLIAHHSNKMSMNGDEANQSASRGASAFTDGIRWQMALTPQTKKSKALAGIPEADRRLFVEAALVKTNYTAPMLPVMLKRGRDGYLDATLTTTSGMQLSLHTKVIGLIAKHVRGISARQFESQYGGVDKSLGLAQRALRAVIADLINEGSIVGGNRKLLKVSELLLQRTAKYSPAPAPTATRRAPRGTTARRADPK